MRRTSYNIYQCPYNEGVECVLYYEHKEVCIPNQCIKCGWNPEVEKERRKIVVNNHSHMVIPKRKSEKMKVGF